MKDKGFAFVALLVVVTLVSGCATIPGAIVGATVGGATCTATMIKEIGTSDDKAFAPSIGEKVIYALMIPFIPIFGLVNGGAEGNKVDRDIYAGKEVRPKENFERAAHPCN